MDRFIAYCGLDCKRCEAYIATISDDDDLRRKVAKEWSELNNVEITPEMINCDGCRTDGRKTVYCDSLCPIRKCASGMGYSTCADCGEMCSCPKVAMVIGNSQEAAANLRNMRKER